MDNDPVLYLVAAAFGFMACVCTFGLHMESEIQICERTIQYQLDKSPEQVKAVIEQERKREGR